MLEKVNIKKLAVESSPLLIILIGVAIVSFLLGPCQTYDTELEFEAALNVVNSGVPFVKAYGTVIDQPPLGFYIEALFLNIFGLSSSTGTTLMSLFGLGSVVLVYMLGKEFYGKYAGFLAAALFGLNPWQLVLSRSFLLDAQCLFFSMLCLFVGVLAIRKGSVKLALATGFVFAAALLTKLYSAFVLVPLILFYIYSRPKNLRRVLGQLAAFSAPALVFAFLWYQIICGVSVLSLFRHNDLKDVVPASTGVVTSPFFVINFLANYGLGLYFIAAVAFALILGLLFRKYFFTPVIIELIFLGTIAIVLGVNVYLGAGLKLNVPYFSAIKYDYQALPFFVLLAASLSPKVFSLIGVAKSRTRSRKLLLYLAALTAMILLAASLISSIYYTNELSTRDYLQYRVEPQVDYGYAFTNTRPVRAGSPLLTLRYLGFAIVLSGLLWASRQSLKQFLKRVNAQWGNAQVTQTNHCTCALITRTKKSEFH